MSIFWKNVLRNWIRTQLYKRKNLIIERCSIFNRCSTQLTAPIKQIWNSENEFVRHSGAAQPRRRWRSGIKERRKSETPIPAGQRRHQTAASRLRKKLLSICKPIQKNYLIIIWLGFDLGETVDFEVRPDRDGGSRAAIASVTGKP